MTRYSLLLGSVHDYHDVQHFIDELQHLKDVQNISCTVVKGKHHFRLSFDSLDGEKAALDLTKAMETYTDDNRWGLDDDLMGQLKVSMTSDARLKEELDDMYELVDREVLPDSQDGATPLIHHEAVKRSWALESRAPAALLDPKFLAPLEQAWNVRIEVIDMVVTIYADNNTILESSIMRFTACQEAMTARAKRRHFFDFHNDEEEVGRYYRVRQPASTVDYDLSRRRFLNNHVELVMVRWDDKSLQYVSIESHSTPIVADERSCLWSFFFKFEFGDPIKSRLAPKSDHELHITNLPPVKGIRMDVTAERNEQVKSWLATNPREACMIEVDHVDAFDEKVSSSKQSSGDIDATVEDKSVNATTQNLEKDMLQVDELTKTAYVRPSRLRAKRVEEIAEEPVPFVPRLIGPTDGSSMNSTAKQSGDRGAAKTDAKVAPTGDSFDSLSFPSLNTKKNASPQDIIRAIGAWDSTRSIGVQRKGPPGHKRPAELPKKSFTAGDYLIADSDKEKRCFQPQGSQRGSNVGSRPKPFDLRNEVWKAVRSPLSNAKLHESVRRELKLEIGKIFVSATSLPSQWRPSKLQPAFPFKPEQWSEIFHAHRDKGSAITAFSPRITDRWFDAEHIIELESAEKTQLFTSACEDGMPEQRTRLQIRCRDKRQGIELIVEVDEAKNSSIYVADPFLVGSVNIHFPKRAWDARIIVQDATTIESLVTQPLRSLIESLCVRAPQKKKHIKDPIVLADKDPQIDILSVEFQRDVIYSVDGQYSTSMELCLTQVQSLWMKQESNRFSAYTLPETGMIKDGRMWWTLCLSSHMTNTAMQRDAVKTRLGDKPKAEAIDKLEKPVKDLVSLAFLLVPLMDPIGMHTSFQRSSGSSSSPHKRSGSSRTGRSQGKDRREPRGPSSKYSGW